MVPKNQPQRARPAARPNPCLPTTQRRAPSFLPCACRYSAAKSTALPTAAGNGSGRLTAGAPGASSSGTPPANAVLPYYTLASLGGRQVFGPFIKLVSYDADSGEYQLTALVVCSSAAQSSILGGSVPPQLVWGEVPGSGAGEAWKHTYTAGAAGDYAVPAGATNTEEAFAVAGSAVGERLAVWRDWQFWWVRRGPGGCGRGRVELKLGRADGGCRRGPVGQASRARNSGMLGT